ncbi:MAG: hypothetical protein R6W81_11535 [Bacteroidales bacterium]
MVNGIRIALPRDAWLAMTGHINGITVIALPRDAWLAMTGHMNGMTVTALPRDAWLAMTEDVNLPQLSPKPLLK